jgi:shikimate 5-dehydrogenase
MAASEFSEMLFVGVSTKSSFVHHVFKEWASCLGKRLFLSPCDIPLGASPDVYRRTVNELRQSYPKLTGALITSHKAAIFDSSAGIFDFLSEDANRLGEVGMAYWSGGRFCGGASDVNSTDRVVKRMLADSPTWMHGCRNAVILGAGGAGVALANTLSINPEVGCTRVTLVESDIARVKRVSELVERWDSNVPITVIQSTVESDELVQNAGVGSLIVNASGLGKDRPGSPVSKSISFPLKSFVWEFNYRFQPQQNPTFLELATAQGVERQLTIEDGWDYFIWGWLGVMSRVVGIEDPLDNYHPCFVGVVNSVRKETALRS